MPRTRLRVLASICASALLVVAMATSHSATSRTSRISTTDQNGTQIAAAISLDRSSFLTQRASRSAPHRDLPDVSPTTTEPPPPPAPPPTTSTTIPARTRVIESAGQTTVTTSRKASPPPPKSTTVQAASSSTSTSSSGAWACILQHESGGNYRTNTGNGYYGAYQFSISTWNSMSTGYDRADHAPPAVQDDAARRLQARSGWGQWPRSARLCGLR